MAVIAGHPVVYENLTNLGDLGEVASERGRTSGAECARGVLVSLCREVRFHLVHERTHSLCDLIAVHRLETHTVVKVTDVFPGVGNLHSAAVRDAEGLIVHGLIGPFGDRHRFGHIDHASSTSERCTDGIALCNALGAVRVNGSRRDEAG